ncbi:hypothetical protein SASPL_147160 [Salvia splendens]|uniref:Uncharacterized protein n=1 Tax=Salvia splendens TaxID=180675 RepID=A0A8X8WE03_SALSN|nr:hypothetical protein SASPL_147160 [Salvia splendens]
MRDTTWWTTTYRAQICSSGEGTYEQKIWFAASISRGRRKRWTFRRKRAISGGNQHERYEATNKGSSADEGGGTSDGRIKQQTALNDKRSEEKSKGLMLGFKLLNDIIFTDMPQILDVQKLTNTRDVVLTKALLHLQRIKGMGYSSSAITYDNIMVLVRNILLIGYNPKGLPDKSDALLWDLIKREEIPTSLQKSCESVAHAKRLKEDSMLLLRLLSYWSFGFFMVYGLGADVELWENKSNSGEKELDMLSERAEAEQHAREEETQSRTCPRSHDVQKLTKTREVVLTKALLHLQRIKGMGYGLSAITYDNIMVLVPNILLIGYYQKGLSDKSDALLWDIINREEIPTSLQKSCEAVDHATRLKEDSMLLLRVLSYWSFGYFMVNELGWCLRDDELWESGKIKSNSGEKELVLLSERAEAEQYAREEETTAQSRTCPRSHDVQMLTKTREVVLTKALLHLQRIKGMGYGSSAITYDNIMVLYRKAEISPVKLGQLEEAKAGLPDKSDALLWDLIKREEIPTSLQKSCEAVDHATRLKEDSMLLLRVLSYWSFGFFMVYELDDELWESGKIKSNSGEKELVLLLVVTVPTQDLPTNPQILD